MARSDWNYTGDMDLAHGGIFWKGDPSEGFVEAVEVTPVSDAGGPDNVWHISNGSIPTMQDKLDSVLSICGYARDGDMLVDSTGARTPLASHEGHMMQVQAFQAYYGLERDAEDIVRIGKVDPYTSDRAGGWNPEPTVILPGNAKLSNWVRREHL